MNSKPTFGSFTGRTAGQALKDNPTERRGQWLAGYGHRWEMFRKQKSSEYEMLFTIIDFIWFYKWFHSPETTPSWWYVCPWFLFVRPWRPAARSLLQHAQVCGGVKRVWLKVTESSWISLPIPKIDISMTNHDPRIWVIVKMRHFHVQLFYCSLFYCFYFCMNFNLASSMGPPCFCDVGVKRVGLLRREPQNSALRQRVHCRLHATWSFQPRILYQHLICGTQAQVYFREQQLSVSKCLISWASWILFMYLLVGKTTENPWNLRPINDGSGHWSWPWPVYKAH